MISRLRPYPCTLSHAVGPGSSPWPALLSAAAGVWLGIASVFAAANPPPNWQPAPDAVFLQEVGRQVTAAEPLNAVAVFDGTVYTGSDQGLYRLAGDQLEPVAELRGPIRRLLSSSRVANSSMAPACRATGQMSRS